MAMAFIRKVKTKSGATAVQIIHKNYGQVTHIDHIGSAHNQAELTTLIVLAKEQLHANQQSLFPDTATSLTIQLKQSYSSLLWQVLRRQYAKCVAPSVPCQELTLYAAGKTYRG
jgi:hypothetical protein